MQERGTPLSSRQSTVTSTQVANIKQLAELANSLEIKATIRNRINPPTFLITENTFVFYEGSRPSLGDAVITPQAFPILIPLARKLQLDDLRQLLSDHPEGDAIPWRNAFKEADGILEQKSLATIVSGNLSGQDLFAKLSEYDAGISQLFQQTARVFAESRNLKIQRPGILDLVTHTVPVSFVLNPKGGTLFVIPKTTYSASGSSDIFWRLLEDNPRLGGDYYYKVKWPNGGATPPTLLRVERSGQVFTINQ